MWSVRSPSFTGEGPVGTDSVILGLGTFFDGEAAGDLDAHYELRLGDDVFGVRVADGAIDVGREPAVAPDAIVTTDIDTLRALIWSHRALEDAVHAGDIAIEGDRDAVIRFSRSSRSPSRAAAWSWSPDRDRLHRAPQVAGRRERPSAGSGVTRRRTIGAGRQSLRASRSAWWRSATSGWARSRTFSVLNP
jgi:alkyl sulfatase-like protein